MGTPRRNRARVTSLLVTALAAAIALTGCGGGTAPTAAPGESASAEPVTIRFEWWGNDDRAAATQQAVDLYMEKNPSIKIETSFAPDAAYWEKMATQVAGGSVPDSFQMKLDIVAEYARKGVIQDLSPFVADGTIDTSAMAQEYLASGLVDGKTFGIPTGRSTQAMIYDPKVWAEYGLPAPEAGWTWADVAAAGEVVKEKTGGEKAVLTDIGIEQAWFETWLLQHGKTMLTDDSAALAFTEQDLADYWTFTTDMVAKGVFTPASVTTGADGSIANSPMVKGQSIAEFNHVSLASAYFESFGEVGLGAIPTDGGANATGSYAGVTQLLVISSKTEHAAEAAAFINWFLNDLESGKILGLVRGMPASSAVLDALSSGFEGGDLATYEFEQAMVGKIVKRPPVWVKNAAQNLVDFRATYDRIIFDQISVADGAKEMFAKYQAAIAG